jgi:hypothetical protein
LAIPTIDLPEDVPLNLMAMLQASQGVALHEAASDTPAGRIFA